MGDRERVLVGLALALVVMLAFVPGVASEELPPGWGPPTTEPPLSPDWAEPTSPEPPPPFSDVEEPPVPPSSSKAAESAEAEVLWPEPPVEPEPPAPVIGWIPKNFEDEEPVLDVEEDEILNALNPSCDPEGDSFVLFRFPQLDPTTTFSDTFGADRDGGARRHRGIDIMGEKYAPVVVVADGTVVRTGTGTRAGHYVVVLHDGGWESRYIHLNNDTPGTDDGLVPLEEALAPGITVGSSVVAGQLLGWVGDSGNAEGTPPHTHFEISEGSHIANPYRCLVQAWRWQERVWELETVIF